MICESEPVVGRRVKSGDLYNHTRHAVEVAAPEFSSDDWCMMRAMESVGLEIKKEPWEWDRNAIPRRHPYRIWNGKDFIVMKDRGMRLEKYLFSSIWKYDSSPWRLRKAVLSTAKKF